MTKREYIEKRKFVRFDVQTKVNVQIQSEQKGKVSSVKVSGISKNFSVEGASFISDRKLEPGSKLKLEIFLSQRSKPVHLKGQIMWSRPLNLPDGKEIYETGVKIATVEKSDEARFIKYVCDQMIQRLGQDVHL